MFVPCGNQTMTLSTMSTVLSPLVGAIKHKLDKLVQSAILFRIVAVQLSHFHGGNMLFKSIEGPNWITLHDAFTYYSHLDCSYKECKCDAPDQTMTHL